MAVRAGRAGRGGVLTTSTYISVLAQRIGPPEGEYYDHNLANIKNFVELLNISFVVLSRKLLASFFRNHFRVKVRL